MPFPAYPMLPSGHVLEGTMFNATFVQQSFRIQCITFFNSAFMKKHDIRGEIHFIGPHIASMDVSQQRPSYIAKVTVCGESMCRRFRHPIWPAHLPHSNTLGHESPFPAYPMLPSGYVRRALYTESYLQQARLLDHWQILCLFCFFNPVIYHLEVS